MNKLTPKQRAWLESLRDNGPQTRSGRGNVPCLVMRMGLTDWYDMALNLECITETGLSALKENTDGK